jgi:fatty acid desaturase
MTSIEHSERLTHPRPDGGIPKIAYPSLLLGAAALSAFMLVSVKTLHITIHAGITIAVNTAVACAMFVVAHEAMHHALGRREWVNEVIGRVAWFFVVPVAAWPAYRYLHREHHKHTNDPELDPDEFATHCSMWQVLIHWTFIEVFYARWYFKHLPTRLRGRNRREVICEVVEVTVTIMAVAGVIAACALTGHFVELGIIALIPQRLGIILLAWWFDWLPHHGLTSTPRSDRYRTARMRVGLEWLMTPLTMSQNYHLIHHLHPWLPFYRYQEAWESHDERYLAYDPPLVSVLGTPMTAEEYRHRRDG